MTTILNWLKNIWSGHPPETSNGWVTTETRKKLFNRVEADLKAGDIAKATKRLEGAVKYWPLDKELNIRLADLHFQNNNLIKAGRYYYLHDKGSDNEQIAIMAFRRSLGNDPMLILRKIAHKRFLSMTLFDDNQIETLSDLLDQVKAKHDPLPRFLWSLNDHISARMRTNSGNK